MKLSIEEATKLGIWEADWGPSFCPTCKSDTIINPKEAEPVGDCINEAWNCLDCGNTWYVTYQAIELDIPRKL